MGRTQHHRWKKRARNTEREQNAEKERNKEGEGNARNLERQSARGCQEQDREEGE